MNALIEKADGSHFKAVIYSRSITHEYLKQNEYEKKITHIYKI